MLLSARRVGASGVAYGVDMTDDMLELARRNAANAGAANVEFHKGQIEDLPLPDASVDVVVSNCVINLSVDKPAVLTEMFRVLVPGGRLAISDVVAEDHMSPAYRPAAGSYVGCIAGRCPGLSTLTGSRRPGLPTPRSPTPPRRRWACTRRSSARSSLPPHHRGQAAGPGEGHQARCQPPYSVG